MQLVELQHYIDVFHEKNVSLVAISVDAVENTTPLVERLGLTYAVLSDPELSVIGTLGLENPDVEGLGLHATLLLDESGRVIYRKIARRRPLAGELLDAVDHHRGVYEPGLQRGLGPPPRPWKGWKLLEAVDMTLKAPPLSHLTEGQQEALTRMRHHLEAREEDNALRVWRQFCEDNMTKDNGDAVWQQGLRVMREVYLDPLPYAQPLESLRAASRALNALADAQAKRVIAEEQGKAGDNEAIGEARRHVVDSARALGDLNRGHLKSLWDLKSMVKAMDELHQARQRAIARGDRHR